jgi:lipopolysaccharide export LptBFGC system permease protein LptF
MAGVLFILLTQTLENSGQVYGINPLVVAWAPTLLMMLITSVAIWRTR